MVKKSNSPEQAWREKYRQLLEKHTAMEEHHELEVTHLKKSLSKLCCAVDGLVPDIDAELKQIRQLATEPLDVASSAKIEQVSEAVVGTMVAIDEQRGAAFLQQTKLAQRMLSNMLELGAKGRVKQQINVLQHAFDKQKGADSALLEQLLTVASDMLNTLIDKTLLEEGRRDKGLLSKIFTGGAAEGADESEASTHIVSALTVPTEIPQELARLLNQTRTDANASQIDLLLQQVNELSEWEQLPGLIDEISSVIVELKGVDKQQFEHFLQQLATKLEAIQGYLIDSEHTQKETFEDSELLDQHVRDQVIGLRSTVCAATSLEDLQQAITTRFDAIIGELDQFHTKQEQYKTKSSEAINLLKNKLEKAEHESNALKTLLKSQREQVMRDPLTQLFNRYGFHERSRHEYLRWKRNPLPLSLVMVDIDHFKRINDSMGHLAGDEALRCVAESMKLSIRETDFIARFGGEEFVLILPNTRLGDAARVINKIRQTIMNLPIKFENKTFSVTVSAGVANFIENDTTSDVLSRADSALYRAKQLGRNQVCCEMVASRR